ncbi:MAG: VWA domain-containing protein [Acidobacteria bacterium]|nr:VWA domain-containing protein [Acidobacteriota bacterium]
MRRRKRSGAGLAAGLALLLSGCRVEFRPNGSQEDWDPVPYQAEVEEGLGAALAILIDTSGSMQDAAPGDPRPKHQVALEAIREMLAVTDAFVARRPDFPIRIAIYHFASDAWPVLPMQTYARPAVEQALSRIPGPGGGTAIGRALLAGRPELYRAGTFWKYLLVVTDGENTSGQDPEKVARHIYGKSEGAVQIYFVAFDTSPEKFGFLKEVGGDVLSAANGSELGRALEEVYQGKILAEEVDVGETEPGGTAVRK